MNTHHYLHHHQQHLNFFIRNSFEKQWVYLPELIFSRLHAHTLHIHQDDDDDSGVGNGGSCENFTGNLDLMDTINKFDFCCCCCSNLVVQSVKIIEITHTHAYAYITSKYNSNEW